MEVRALENRFLDYSPGRRFVLLPMPSAALAVILVAWVRRAEDSAMRSPPTEQFTLVEALVTLQFYADPGSTEAGAILTFSDRVMEHIAMISGWEEFERFLATVRPVDVRVYGKLSAEAEAWVRQFGVVSRTFEDHVAGFVRYPP
jgi:hypothetical protein